MHAAFFFFLDNLFRITFHRLNLDVKGHLLTFIFTTHKSFKLLSSV